MAPVALRVSVAYSPAPRQVELTELVLPAGATVGDALAASGLGARHPGIDLGAHAVAVWGERRPLTAPLVDGDRVDVARPLALDPKEARRARHRRQREARGSGAR